LSAARERILERLRSGGTRLAAAGGAATAPSRPLPPRDPLALASRFAWELGQVGGVAHEPVPVTEAARELVRVLRENHAHDVLAWHEADLGVPGIEEALEHAGFHLMPGRLPATIPARAERLRRLADADAGLTGASAGLAGTGSLVLESGPGRARLAWLLPPLHVALLPIDRLYAGLAEYLAARDGPALETAHVAIVSGPSRSIDIELVATRGAHGPAGLHVILIR
jgi:L-lactate dehydrogenase complex protein LldG